MPTILKYLGDFRTVARYGEDDVRRMLSDRNMIRHRRKIEACIHNAREFERIIQKYGSFANYLDSFGVSFDDYEGVKKKIRPALIKRFKGIGKVTVYHYLTDLGFEVMKPDRTILRLFYRLGWLKSPEPTDENIDKTIRICREIAEKLNMWIRVVDIMLVAFCQENGNRDLGIERGICTKTPKCDQCRLGEYCEYYQKIQSTKEELMNGSP
ncbi:DNA-3-methyladenine glycosylase I [Pyrococcus yayanosii]|uniref:Putative methyladenine DNA glycosylase n=1 Tax=Pyrococcus yayanosii (strain CH1 / JCM 16557) TaxID=529709 RepID=F8AGI4_PYRYC|nr:DNA-3-methyladenine glycosylase I [Pyrococcus yayanosii]AEH25185.1 putative methyladenine DNA glycosylase [Pyrococcus yayanosii CH1]